MELGLVFVLAFQFRMPLGGSFREPEATYIEEQRLLVLMRFLARIKLLHQRFDPKRSELKVRVRTQDHGHLKLVLDRNRVNIHDIIATRCLWHPLQVLKAWRRRSVRSNENFISKRATNLYTNSFRELLLYPVRNEFLVRKRASD